MAESLKTIADLMDAVKRIEQADESIAVTRDLVIELKTALVDLVDLLEKQGPMTAKAVAEGLRSAQLGQITVQPAPVQVIDKTVNAAAVPSKGQRIEFEFDKFGSITGAILKPLS